MGADSTKQLASPPAPHAQQIQRTLSVSPVTPAIRRSEPPPQHFYTVALYDVQWNSFCGYLTTLSAQKTQGPTAGQSENYPIVRDVESGFGGLEVACWPLVPKFAGSHPAEAVGFLGRKIPQHAFLRRGSKDVGPMS